MGCSLPKACRSSPGSSRNAGFDGRPDTFLELSTARLRFGPLWTPFFTNIVLRDGGEEIALNSLGQALRARGRFEYFRWRFASATPDVSIEGTISAPPDAFVGLAYRNPPGGTKHCLNTKIAACDLRLTRGGRTETLTTRHRVAFAGPLQQRIALELPFHVGDQIQVRELQQLDGLHQLRRHHERLALAHLQALRQCHVSDRLVVRFLLI